MASTFLTLNSVLPLWITAALASVGSAYWAVRGVSMTQSNQRLSWGLLIAAVGATMVATLAPASPPTGLETARFTLDPFLNLRQMLRFSLDSWNINFNQVWAWGNLILLWPLGASLAVHTRSLKKSFVLLTICAVTIELTQGLLSFLGRSFEVSDILSNLSGVLLLLLSTRRRYEGDPSSSA